MGGAFGGGVGVEVAHARRLVALRKRQRRTAPRRGGGDERLPGRVEIERRRLAAILRRGRYLRARRTGGGPVVHRVAIPAVRSEEHTSELQSLMRISYAVFCLKKKKKTTISIPKTTYTKQKHNHHNY